MGLFGIFLKSYWKELVIVGILVAGYLYYENLVGTIADQQKTIATQKANIATLEDSVTKQNTAVDNLKAEYEAKLQAGKKALDLARAKSKTFKQQASDIDNSAPAFPNDLCKSADMLINKELQ
jgi:septal ring factor EnvC (AmiA/AmiB activator)